MTEVSEKELATLSPEDLRGYLEELILFGRACVKQDDEGVWRWIPLQTVLV